MKLTVDYEKAGVEDCKLKGRLINGGVYCCKNCDVTWVSKL